MALRDQKQNKGSFLVLQATKKGVGMIIFTHTTAENKLSLHLSIKSPGKNLSKCCSVYLFWVSRNMKNFRVPCNNPCRAGSFLLPEPQYSRLGYETLL